MTDIEARTDGVRSASAGKAATAASRIPLGREGMLARLEEALAKGELAPGDKLPSERALSEQYSVSRPAVREALQRLRERGLIHVSPGSGAYVREPSALDWARPLDAAGRQRAATTRQLVEARAMLEEHAVRLACEHATDEDIDKLERALAAFHAATGVIERARCDIAFHALIATASHNPVIEMMFGSIAPMVFEVMLRSLDDPQVLERGGPLHDTVLVAIRRHDADRAAKAIAEHIGLASRMFGADFDAQLDVLARRTVVALLGPGAELQDVIAWALDGG